MCAPLQGFTGELTQKGIEFQVDYDHLCCLFLIKQYVMQCYCLLNRTLVFPGIVLSYTFASILRYTGPKIECKGLDNRVCISLMITVFSGLHSKIVGMRMMHDHGGDAQFRHHFH